MDDRPAPLVGVEVDLRGYEFMPLYGDRLLKSETWISGSAEARVAALRLWWHAFAHEVPAGSLPDDDRLLADYAGYGVAVKAFIRIKPSAMKNWVACADGRLYHPVVAEIVVGCWNKRLSASARGRAGSAKRWGKPSHEEVIAKPLPQPSGNHGSANALAIENDSSKNAKDSKGYKKGLVVDNTKAREALALLVKRPAEREPTDEATLERHREAARKALENAQGANTQLDDDIPF